MRDIRFNFDALLDIAVKSSDGARDIVSCEKKEGSFNRAFVILMDNRVRCREFTELTRWPSSLDSEF